MFSLFVGIPLRQAGFVLSEYLAFSKVSEQIMDILFIKKPLTIQIARNPSYSVDNRLIVQLSNYLALCGVPV